MKVVIQKPDLDTCLTALIIGVAESDEVTVLKGEAPEADLNDPTVFCIEAGGSGLVHLNNFDHHDANQSHPPACRQAYDKCSINDEKLTRLVDYVCMVDVRIHEHPPIPFPSLSNLFSGMRLVKKSFMQQFFCGIEMLKIMLTDDIDPFSTMPDLEGWRVFKLTKENDLRVLNNDLKNAMCFQSASNKKIGFLESAAYNGSGALYKQGCNAVIMMNNSFGDPPSRKFTIAGNRMKVRHLLTYIDPLEKGWGGQDTETIISSPYEGSNLTKEAIIEIVRQHL